jgi:hypothetical protein
MKVNGEGLSFYTSKRMLVENSLLENKEFK